MRNPQTPTISYGSSTQPSNYVARKLTRHYYTEVANFLDKRQPPEIESFRREVAEALGPFKDPAAHGKPKLPNGDYFFAAVVRAGAAIDTRDIAIGGYLEYGPADNGAGARLATLSHIAVNEELLAENPRLLIGFFQLVHRAASARSRTQLMLTTALESSLPRFLTRSGYQIVSHEFSGDINRLSVSFRIDIVPGYTGDVLKWTPLCWWYLSLSFSQFLGVRGLDSSATEQAAHSIPIKITPLCRADGTRAPRFLEQVKEHLQPVPVNAVILPTIDLFQPERVADELDKHLQTDKYNIALLNCRSPSAPALRSLRTQCALVYRDEVERALKDVKGLYFSTPSPGLEKERWRRLLRLKLGFDRRDRSGVIVEIDRESYVQMLKKLDSEPKLEGLLFFNDGGFGEALQPGCTVFFYVWDSLGIPRSSELPGVIAAMGSIADVKAWTFSQLNASWPDLSRYTIWKEPFAEQYFSEPVVGFFIKNLECAVERPGDDFEHGPLPGIAYEAILPHLFAMGMTSSAEMSACEELLPTWDVKNVYLEEDMTFRFAEDLANRAGSKIRSYISTRKNSVPRAAPLQVAAPADPMLGAAYWIEHPPSRSSLPAPDVFFSFAGADEVGDRGWKSFIMDMFSGALKAEGFQAPYVFDEAGKREALGREWASGLVERMSCCKTALILWSPSYLSSSTCYQLELPYMLERRKRNNLPMYWLRLMDTPVTRLRWEGVDLGPEPFDVNSVNDDRLALDRATSYPKHLRDATLQGLRDNGHIDLLNQRLNGTFAKIIDDLKKMRDSK